MSKRLVWDELWAAMRTHYVTNADYWVPTTEDMSDDQLGAVPPEAMSDSAFLVGEPADHNADGEAVYACFWNRGSYETPDYVARYLTLKEFVDGKIGNQKVEA